MDSNGPRSLEFDILRTCERLHLSEAQFHSLEYNQQIKLLAYSQIRAYDESPPDLPPR